jgi:hypothetical protein
MWKFLPGVSKPESKRKVDTVKVTRHTMPQKGRQHFNLTGTIFAHPIYSKHTQNEGFCM